MARRPIGVFPEGTRSRNGVLREPKFGVSLLAIRSGAPLLPVGISGSGKIFPGRSRWPHRTRVEIRIGRVDRCGSSTLPAEAVATCWRPCSSGAGGWAARSGS